jgi:hypothetical protein
MARAERLPTSSAARLPVAHGFSPRGGGVSAPPWHALNLGASVGDDPAAVVENRRRVARAFGVSPNASPGSIRSTAPRCTRPVLRASGARATP